MTRLIIASLSSVIAGLSYYKCDVYSYIYILRLEEFLYVRCNMPLAAFYTDIFVV